MYLSVSSAAQICKMALFVAGSNAFARDDFTSYIFQNKRSHQQPEQAADCKRPKVKQEPL